MYKNAPFDVTESKLRNTFFQTWDSIKNNVLLNWVDVTDGSGKYSLALFTDHTTNYIHGQNNALGLTTQYSGVGLWGKNYSIDRPTEFSYALLPHKNKWDESNVWTANTNWNNTMSATIFRSETAVKNYDRSLIKFSGDGIELTSAIIEGNDLVVRLFNSKPLASAQTIFFDGTAKRIDLIELNGNIREHVNPLQNKSAITAINISIQKFGIQTIRLTGFKATL